MTGIQPIKLEPLEDDEDIFKLPPELSKAFECAIEPDSKNDVNGDTNSQELSKSSVAEQNSFACAECTARNPYYYKSRNCKHSRNVKAGTKKTSSHGNKLLSSKVIAKALGNVRSSNRIQNRQIKTEVVTVKEESFSISDSEEYSPNVCQKSTKLVGGKSKYKRKSREPVECSICGKVFARKENMRFHVFTVHCKLKRFHCDICGRFFSKKQALTVHHQLIHSGVRPFQCDICGKPCGTKPNLKSHRESHDKHRIGGACDLCGKTFTTMKSLRIHKRNKTCEKGAEGSTYWLPCKKCKVKFRNKSILESHTCQESHCHICGKTFESASVFKNHLKHHEKAFACETCEKRFSSASHLKVHMFIHTGEKPFGCTECGQNFTTKSYLTVHSRIHSGEKPYPCNLCPLRFVKGSDLKVHMRHHTGEKPYQCKVCNERFRVNAALRRHIRRHTGERPYACDQCSRTFIDRSALRLHAHTHATGRSTFDCQFCTKTFKSLVGIRYHLRTKHKSECNADNPEQSFPDASGKEVAVAEVNAVESISTPIIETEIE